MACRVFFEDDLRNFMASAALAGECSAQSAEYKRGFEDAVSIIAQMIGVSVHDDADRPVRRILDGRALDIKSIGEE